MLVYRLSLTKFAKDKSGEGAQIFGGRWNDIGTSCMYTSETRALAILEYAANVPIENIPGDLSIICFDLPLKTIPVIKPDELPADWQMIPASTTTKQWGTIWLESRKQLAIKVPSVIVPDEYNVIINPLHADINKVLIESISPYPFDKRIKK